jgi:hypothetical protein
MAKVKKVSEPVAVVPKFGPGDKVTLNRDIVGSAPPTRDHREWVVVGVNDMTAVAVVFLCGNGPQAHAVVPLGDLIPKV